LWAMWRDGNVYEPSALGRKTARGLHQAAQSLEFRAEQLTRASRKHSYRRIMREVPQLS
jgi:hypothetical protein